MDLLKIIHERRSIRRYRNDPIPDEIIIEILEAARAAPSWANTQVCRYIVVKDPQIKEKLKEVLSPTNPAREAFIQAPIVICQFAQRGLSGCKKNEPVTNKGDWFMFDAGIAMEHIILAAWNFGLGTVHVGSFDAEKAEKILGIPDGFSIVEMTPVGYFDETPKPTPRRPLKESVFLDVFGRPFIS
ncbi:MAG TPA: nitroreductase family protein [Syntrophorhabdaceae bacterium]|nr:nitroreductase family protein [Syntrophorhabdaceae bacterium]HQE81305.1 nitroreductase family protein [Syntrophorhabdaceae bacterium]